MTPPGFFIVFAGACQANLPCIYTCEMGVEQKNSMALRRNAAKVGITSKFQTPLQVDSRSRYVSPASSE
jgi:hypothetical protein